MPDDQDDGPEITTLPDDPYRGRGGGGPNALLAPQDPLAEEGRRLLRLARMLGRRLSYALGHRQLGPMSSKCPHCGQAPPAQMPEEATVKTFAEYGKIVGMLLKEQRERVSLIYKYRLKPTMSDEEIQAKVRAIFEDVLDQLPDDELAAALERRRRARAREAAP